jgi:hypothetical protein
MLSGCFGGASVLASHGEWDSLSKRLARTLAPPIMVQTDPPPEKAATSIPAAIKI